MKSALTSEPRKTGDRTKENGRDRRKEGEERGKRKKKQEIIYPGFKTYRNWGRNKKEGEGEDEKVKLNPNFRT